jgi:hypothetical protein
MFFACIKASILKMNTQRLGYAAYILHNALQTSSDILAVEDEAMVNKMFQYFHMYIIRVEELKKEFCDFVDVEYKQILGSVKTRWLSLQPAITRVISIFPALKSYFLFQEKCTMMLRKMFNDPVSLVSVYFLESQTKVCSISIEKLQSDSILESEVAVELDILSDRMRNRRGDNFHTKKLISLLSDVEDVYSNEQFT